MACEYDDEYDDESKDIYSKDIYILVGECLQTVCIHSPTVCIHSPHHHHTKENIQKEKRNAIASPQEDIGAESQKELTTATLNHDIHLPTLGEIGVQPF